MRQFLYDIIPIMTIIVEKVKKMKVVLIPGDGIGKEIADSVKKVAEVLKCDIECLEPNTLRKAASLCRMVYLIRSKK